MAMRLPCPYEDNQDLHETVISKVTVSCACSSRERIIVVSGLRCIILYQYGVIFSLTRGV
jgi:hypothetical protein